MEQTVLRTPYMPIDTMTVTVTVTGGKRGGGEGRVFVTVHELAEGGHVGIQNEH